MINNAKRENMAKTSRQTAIFGTEDWKRIYKTYKEADFQSYNFETLRKTFVDYLRQHHPESFNDYTESSEFIAMLNVMAFMGQSLSFRNDLNTRENFLDTAERRDSVNALSSLVSYTSKRNIAAAGYLKVLSLNTTENVTDYNRNNLNNVTVRWNDKTNDDWQEQFTTILNAALVDSQKIGSPSHTANILGIKTSEYSLNMAQGTLPVVPFTATVDEVSMNFEVVNGTSINEDFIYEPAPKLNGNLNVLFRNDNQGFASANTGYFFYFKQGSLQSQDFTMRERIANRSIDVTIDGINNDDVWLYKIDTEQAVVSDQWDEVENIYSSNNTQLDVEERKFFSVSSRANDQITLNFGDGVFSEIPVGSYRSYIRKSNGLDYVINPEEIQNVDVSFDYLSRTGRLETLTLTLGLTTAVSNAKTNEDIDDIKRRAPARFYTQDRMVNGEDYNNFPYTSQSSIIKSKAVNRSNIGASRYLELLDPTGKYSSINAYASDGLLHKDANIDIFNFTFNDKNDIDFVFKNKVEPTLAERSTIQYYYDTFYRPQINDTPGITWNQRTTITNETTGYFVDINAAEPKPALPIGSSIGGSRKYLTTNALVKFVPPAGNFFDENNRLVFGNVQTAEDKEYIWATISNLELDGTGQGEIHSIPSREGPVTLNNFVPTGAIPTEVIPLFNSNLPTELEQEMLVQVELYRDFGLAFDHLNNVWSIILADDLTADNWIMKFESDQVGYTVSTRALNYFFSSVIETRFFFDNNTQIFDPRTGKIVNDFVNVLRTNSKPGPDNVSLSGDIILDIIDQSVESDGYVNDYIVEVSFTDSDNDGIADDPDFFDAIVEASSLVYFQSETDFDNLERFLPVPSSSVNTDYATKDKIEEVKTEHVNGQLFYTTDTKLFYELVVNGADRAVNEKTNMRAEDGRGELHFQYRHNSPESTRINPSVTNIIDIYVVTSSYYNDFTQYIQDSTNTVAEPAVPTTDELTVQYNELQGKKMTSDNIVLNSVAFKPLFGDKAAASLQAYVKVVKLKNTVTSDSEIKSQVISEINSYFDIDNWDFGDTFYFSELAAFVHRQLGDIIGSVVIVPKDANKSFGDLYEIRSAPHEIFANAATVNDVVLINSLTESELQSRAI